MALSPGTQLGSYRIVSPVGAGGMGEVYRASDTRLGRDVAIKILPDHLSGVADIRERFEREARVISSLSHPNICTLFDIGTHNNVSYLVMELLEGETLAKRLERGPLRLDEALRSGAQVADALDKAHRRGIVHRDLKPSNVMLSRSGVKVLDFGVAKLRDDQPGTAPGAGALPTTAQTRTTPITQQGTIIGTMQYMAPEQLEGRAVDHRADIFSFGALLHEMVTGKRAFEGASQASVIAAIMERDPRPVSELSPDCPPLLDRTIRRCLAKDPEDRWQSALDVKSELEWIAQQSDTTQFARLGTAAPGRRRSGAATGLLAVLGAAAVFALGWTLRQPALPRAALTRTSIVMARGMTLDTDNTSIALSPDGTMLVSAGRESGGALQLSVRPLDSLTAQPLAGTDGATYPFWSPDGRQIGFFADKKLKKVPASGGTVQTICDAEDGRGASWGADGAIVFAPRARGGLSMVPAAGGAPVPITVPADDRLTHRNPHFLPDGKRLLYFSGINAGDPDNGVFSLDIATKKTDRVIQADSEGIYVGPGYLAWVKEGNLVVQPMDAATLSLSGEAVPVAEGVQFNTFRYTGTYAFSSTGLLLYRSGAIQGETQLTWYDMGGKSLGTVGDPAIFWLKLAIAPDSARAAATVRHPDGGSDLWMYDLIRGIGTRFTMGETNALVPLWSPDGRQVAYIDGNGSLYVKAADGATPPRKLYSSPGNSLFPTDWSPDSSTILWTEQSAKTGSNLLTMKVTGEPSPTVYLDSTANESGGDFSPDGRWVAYLSDESGRDEVYVRSFPGAGGKWQISAQGAQSGGWLGGRAEIWYVDLQGKAFAVPLSLTGSAFTIGAARPLFDGKVLPVVVGEFTPDGRRYLGATTLGGDVGPILTLVTNWHTALEKR